MKSRQLFTLICVVVFLVGFEVKASDISWTKKIVYVNTNCVQEDTYRQLISGKIVDARYTVPQDIYPEKRIFTIQLITG